MQLEYNDREKTVILTALDLLRDVKQRSLIGTEEEKTNKPINEFDLLASPHTLMHCLTLLSKLTKKPIEHFSRNPSQTPPPTTHIESPT